MPETSLHQNMVQLGKKRLIEKQSDSKEIGTAAIASIPLAQYSPTYIFYSYTLASSAEGEPTATRVAPEERATEFPICAVPMPTIS